MMADRITGSLFSEGIISDEDMEIVRFGLESLIGNLLGIVLTLTVGICFKRVGEALLLWPLLFLLRKNAGGYHAATKKRCLLISVVMLVMCFTFFSMISHTMISYVICAIVTGCIIWLLAPVDNLSKKLDDVEHKVYKMRSRIILGVEGAALALVMYFKLFNWEIVARSVCMTFFVVSISLLMGVAFKKRIFC